MKGSPEAFYSAVAALIPLLFIAAIIEQQRFYLRLREPHFTRTLVALFVFSLLAFCLSAIYGEALALRALLRGPDKGSLTAVETSLTVMAAFLILGIAVPILATLEENGAPHAFGIGMGTIAACEVAAFVLIYAL